MISFEKLLSKAAKYCAWQERCASDLQKKIKSWGATENDAQKVIEEMIRENYIDHQRLPLHLPGENSATTSGVKIK